MKGKPSINQYSNRFEPSDGTEYVYYEAQYINDKNGPVIASFTDVKTEPIVMNMKDYKMAITRFNIGMEALPMFIKGVSKTICQVGMYYEPDNLSATGSVFSAVSTLPIYTITGFLDEPNYGGGLNPTIISVFNNIVSQYDTIHGAGAWAANPLTPKNPPGFIFNSATQLFTFYSDVLSLDTEVNKVTLWLSIDISKLFLGLQLHERQTGAPFAAPNWYRFAVFDTYNQLSRVFIPPVTGDEYIVMEQTYNSTSKWYTINKLLVTSKSLGTRKSYVGILKSSGQNNSNAIQYEILSDTYVMLANTPNENPASQLVYIPVNYKWIDCLKSGPLSQVDFTLEFLDEQGSFYTASILPGESFSITIVLAKKPYS